MKKILSRFEDLAKQRKDKINIISSFIIDGSKCIINEDVYMARKHFKSAILNNLDLIFELKKNEQAKRMLYMSSGAMIASFIPLRDKEKSMVYDEILEIIKICSGLIEHKEAAANDLKVLMQSLIVFPASIFMVMMGDRVIGAIMMFLLASVMIKSFQLYRRSKSWVDLKKNEVLKRLDKI